MKRKKLGAEFTQVSAGEFDAVITATTIDRDNEVVVAQGMNAVEYEQNPVLFWNHDWANPVGKCVSLKREAERIVGRFKLAEQPDDWQGAFFPSFVGALIGQGIVRGVSIGYVPEQGGVRKATADDRTRYGDSVTTVYSKWKLLEVSVAPLQANPQALVTAVRKGAIDPEDAKRWLGYAPPPRVQIVVDVPVRASRKTSQPIDALSVVRAELARARGQLWL